MEKGKRHNIKWRLSYQGSKKMSDCDPDSDGRTQGCVEMDFSQKIHKSCSLSDQMTIEGCLLWAKIRGFSYWPGITTVDPYEGVTSKVIESSKRYEKFKELAYKFPKRKKDFEPGKKFRNIFERAVKEAEAVMCIPVALRLEKLGFVYIPTNIDGGQHEMYLLRKRKVGEGVVRPPSLKILAVDNYLEETHLI
ncbi:unnamed protein product [Lepeophtheirus salmonis]|uniref:(salmon louse) hypothetical protein n=1 Tax=Lepeophtheirus salmonis TaxID=72036 RepID=A0A7R8H377_LEPSM|nr:unnamed protein product [Lepeophtheirus salmonis]CAF2842033.1 unnamed protein product [Lepeophtheirus salmonis]